MSYSNKKVFDPYANIKMFGVGSTLEESVANMKPIKIPKGD